ncbi:MAG: DUF262 domain-containing protein [Anaerolineales bacterium]
MANNAQSQENVQTKIDSSDLSLAEIYKDFYSVPDFQREYVWEETNVEKLLQDVYDEFYDENNKLTQGGEYFIGSIVTYKDGDGVFQLIDGQQRLTTSYLILCVIRDILLELETEPPGTINGQISSVSMNPKTGEDIFRYRLVLQYEDSQNILETIAGKPGSVGEIKPGTTSVENIVDAYKTIREFLQANFDNDASKIKTFAAAITLRVKLIRIVTPNLSSALKLFETINDRGVGLNSMDLLKNLLFMRTTKEEYSKLKDRWKELIDTLDNHCKEKPLRFLRYYILSTYELPANKREVREDEIYKWFSDNQNETGIQSEPIKFVDLLIRYAKAYANFVAGKNARGSENRYLQNIARLSNQARQHFILLLAAQGLDDALFSKLAQKIENLFFCYLITREPTKNFERIFARWSTKLRAVRNEKDLDDFIKEYFDAEMSKHERDFDFALRELTTARIQQYRIRYILARMNQFIDEQARSAEIPLVQYYKAVEIEHILAQNPDIETRQTFDKPEEYDTWKIRLGNLTLLEKSINASISNLPYTGKQDGYKSSQFYMTQSLAQKIQVGVDTKINRATKDLLQFAEWTSETIQKRQEMLIQLAHQVWEFPKTESTE